jgi:hypothetical protein
MYGLGGDILRLLRLRRLREHRACAYGSLGGGPNLFILSYTKFIIVISIRYF